MRRAERTNRPSGRRRSRISSAHRTFTRAPCAPSPCTVFSLRKVPPRVRTRTGLVKMQIRFNAFSTFSWHIPHIRLINCWYSHCVTEFHGLRKIWETWTLVTNNLSDLFNLKSFHQNGSSNVKFEQPFSNLPEELSSLLRYIALTIGVVPAVFGSEFQDK